MTHGNIKCMTHFHCLTTSQLPIPGKAPWYRGQWCSLIFKKWSESWDEVLSVPRPNLSVPFQIDSLIEVVQVRNVKQCFPQCFAYLNMYEGAQLASLFHGTNSLAYYTTRFLIGVSLWGTWNTLTHGRRTESIVVMCWQMRSMHLGSSHRCVTDQLSPCCQKKKCGVACCSDWGETQVCQSPQRTLDLSPAMYCQQCHPASPVNHHLTHWHTPPRVWTDSGRGLKSAMFIYNPLH